MGAIDEDEGSSWLRPARRIFQVPYIDRVLRSKGLRRIVGYPYSAGDCLFDSVLYLLGEEEAYESSVCLRRAMVSLYREKFHRKDPKAMEWMENFLVLENLQELHPELGRIKLTEKDAALVYLCKMRLSASCGGLWGDHFCAFWLQELLGRPIEIWLADTGKILGDEEDHSDNVMRLVYHSNYHGFSFAHYEPVVAFERMERFRWSSLQVIHRKRFMEDDLEDEVLEEETETESDNDEEEDDDDEPPPLPPESSQGCSRAPWLEDDNPERPDRLVSVSSAIEGEEMDESATARVEEQEVAETLKEFSSDIKTAGGSTNKLPGSRHLQPKRLKTDSPSLGESTVEISVRQPDKQEPTARREPLNTKVLEADCGRLSNFEVLDLLQSRDGISQSEVLVRRYLLQTPAASQSIEDLRKLSREPLIRRLCPLERIQIANLRPDPVQLYLIIQNIQKRFSNDEIDAMVATVNRFLTEPQKV
ncbi:uncharacterized protein LOC112349395 [Selaginella moellendorffii]|uniref:uncharacterized protein LOC112349395 n=1 Tax=Selaginella moellendorffii TaxID=88036 RepID=UPI000D1C6383|nr:uncharacterized protein LOC112349395 [Selaginella moellendorffii]|eukprot:XP_024539513.1 uncharacterized protein LOC112349395 [Selaginella moellendorffii]